MLEPGADRLPVIARQDDYQTCFMCEASCPTDALFVAPAMAVPPTGPEARRAAKSDQYDIGFRVVHSDEGEEE